MQSLNQLEQSVQTLLSRYAQQQTDLQTLRETNERQRQEILRTHSELFELKKNYQALLTAHQMVGGQEDRQRAKQQLSRLIEQVSKAMEVLKN